MNRYQPIFSEAVSKDKMFRAVQLISKILGRRLGSSVYASELPIEVDKAGEGAFQGIMCTTDKGQQLKFNWRVSGGSGEVDTIDIWHKPGLQPDLTVDVNDVPLVKVVDVIGNAIETGKYDSVMVPIEERSLGITQPTVLSVNSWLQSMHSFKGDIDKNYLENTRLSYMYKDYSYWYNDVNEDDAIKFVSMSGFRTFMLDAFNKEGIDNKFIKVVNIRRASKEKIKVDAKEEKLFDDALLTMNLNETIEYLKSSVLMVARGYTNSVLVCGTSGIGKTRLVKQMLKDEGSKFVWKDGGVKNTQALFELFKNNNKKDLIIVFDDMDDVLSNKNLDIMKAALSADDPRIVSWHDAKYKDTAKKYVPEIEFKSRIVIISNKPANKIHPALRSRAAAIEVNVAIPDIIDDIRINLESIMPEVDFNLKKEVLDFVDIRLKNKIQQFDYRLFKLCVIHRLTGNNNWKKFCVPILKLKVA